MKKNKSVPRTTSRGTGVRRVRSIPEGFHEMAWSSSGRVKRACDEVTIFPLTLLHE